MNLHAILEAIRQSSNAEIARIEARALAQAREILIDARLEAENIKKQACKETSEPGMREQTRILHRARLEALKIVGDERENLVDIVVGQSWGWFAGLRSHQIYPTVLRKLLKEAFDELDQNIDTTGNIGLIGCLEADPRDRQLLEEILREMELQCSVHYTLNSLGGLVVKSTDGRIAVINTVESRLERAMPFLRRSLAAFFEGKHFESED